MGATPEPGCAVAGSRIARGACQAKVCGAPMRRFLPLLPARQRIEQQKGCGLRRDSTFWRIALSLLLRVCLGYAESSRRDMEVRSGRATEPASERHGEIA